MSDVTILGTSFTVDPIALARARVVLQDHLVGFIKGTRYVMCPECHAHVKVNLGELDSFDTFDADDFIASILTALGITEIK